MHAVDALFWGLLYQIIDQAASDIVVPFFCVKNNK